MGLAQGALATEPIELVFQHTLDLSSADQDLYETLLCHPRISLAYAQTHSQQNNIHLRIFFPHWQLRMDNIPRLNFEQA